MALMKKVASSRGYPFRTRYVGRKVIAPTVTQDRSVEPVKRRITGFQFSSPSDSACRAATGQVSGIGRIRRRSAPITAGIKSQVIAERPPAVITMPARIGPRA
jgi:hypothetical protein